MKVTSIVLNILTVLFFGYEVFNDFATGNILGTIVSLIFLAISGWSMWHKMRKGL